MSHLGLIMIITEIVGKLLEPYEYFCRCCLQIRLSFVISDKCRNCGSKDIVKGKMGSLDKEKLIAQSRVRQDIPDVQNPNKARY